MRLSQKLGIFLLSLFVIGMAKQPTLSQEPVATLENLDGEKIALTKFIEDRQGKVLLVNFWATWCPPCREEIPILASLHRKYEEQNVEVIGISIDRRGLAIVEPFVERWDMPYQVLVGDDAVVQSFGGLMGVPTTFVLSREGKIVKKFIGAQYEEVLENAIESVRSQEASSPDQN